MVSLIFFLLFAVSFSALAKTKWKNVRFQYFYFAFFIRENHYLLFAFELMRIHFHRSSIVDETDKKQPIHHTAYAFYSSDGQSKPNETYMSVNDNTKNSQTIFKCLSSVLCFCLLFNFVRTKKIVPFTLQTQKEERKEPKQKTFHRFFVLVVYLLHILVTCSVSFGGGVVNDFKYIIRKTFDVRSSFQEHLAQFH